MARRPGPKRARPSPMFCYKAMRHAKCTPPCDPDSPLVTTEVGLRERPLRCKGTDSMNVQRNLAKLNRTGIRDLQMHIIPSLSSPHLHNETDVKKFGEI